MRIGMLPSSGGASTSSAVQVDVAGEVAGLTAATVASGDYVMIEDADDSNNKKRTTAGAIADLAAAGAAVLASYTVAGAAKQTINFGPGGDAYTSGTFSTGRRYALRARILPTTVANTHSFDLRPNALTTNMYSQYHGATNATASAGRVVGGTSLGGTASDVEEYMFNIEWDELAGFDRFFVIDSTAQDTSGTIVEYTFQYRLIWAQTPAEDALDNLVLGCTQADGFGIGSKIWLMDLGPCA